MEESSAVLSIWLRFEKLGQRIVLPLKYLALTVTDRFGPTVGSKLLKPSGIKRTSWGDRQVDRIKMRAELPGALAPL
jgi:hypothetical protein